MNTYEDASGIWTLDEAGRSDTADRLAIAHARALAAEVPPERDGSPVTAALYYATRCGRMIAELEGLAWRLERRLGESIR